MDTIVIVSGGMDSVTLAHLLKSQGHTLHLLSFDYGQRHRRELECAAWQANYLEAKHTIIDISGIRPLLKGSALTDDIPVPHGHYEEETMRATVVPNRNAIMLSIAWGMACAEGAKFLACGVHAGDHHIYPDCRRPFIDAIQDALQLGTEGHGGDDLMLLAPFLSESKTGIAEIGTGLDVPYEHTWTCYEGGEKHCGKCGACVERKEAFRDNSIIDPTEYAE